VSDPKLSDPRGTIGIVPRRVVATVVFTDIVGSTALAARVGDNAWGDILDRHNDVARTAAALFGGQIWKWTGDGALMTFAGPADAVRCAAEIRRVMATHGVEVRAGVHVGPVDVRHGDLSGLTVNIAARVTAAARSGGIVASQTAAECTSARDVLLAEEGSLGLPGVDGDWRVFRVVATGSPQPRTGQQTSVRCASRSSGSPVGR
jgi:class 3 adenylate cyclase